MNKLQTASFILCAASILSAATLARADETTGKWAIQDYVSPGSSQRSYFAGLTAEKPADNSTGSTTPATVSLGCGDGVTILMLAFPTMPAKGKFPLRYSVDGGPEHTATVVVPASEQIMGMGGTAAIEMIRTLKGGKALNVALTVPSSGDQQAKFEIGGIDSVVARMEEICGW